MNDETGINRDNIQEVGYKKPPADKSFTATNQPDPMKQRITKAKKKFGREVIKEMLKMKYEFTPDSQIKQQLIKAFGPKVLKMSVLEVMSLQQMNKAILKADTNALALLLNQAYGMPKQELGLTDNEGNDIITKVGYGSKETDV